MEALLVILIIAFVALSGRNKNKKPRSGAQSPLNAARARQPVMERRAAKAKPERAFMDRLAEATRAKLEALEEAAQKEAAVQKAPAPEGRLTPIEAEQGISVVDGEGCVGGSMAHDHDEGERRQEHARHLEAARRREAVEVLQEAEAELQRRSRAAELRRAVVMAEVLDRPVALRPRGCGRRAS